MSRSQVIPRADWSAASRRGRKPARSLSRIQKRYETRRLEILRAAGRTFRKQGLAETGMRDIAAAADLSPANLYNYFRGKHELLFFCQDSALDRMLKALKQAAARKGSAAGKLSAVIESHLHCVLDEVEGSAAHLFAAAMPAPLQKKLMAKRDRYEEGVRKMIAAGIRSGEFVPCDPALAARAILGALNWSTGWFHPEGELTSAQLAQEFGRYLTRGLLSAPPAVRNDAPVSAKATAERLRKARDGDHAGRI
jgi:TetR/AcrR family transcriptional regulator